MAYITSAEYDRRREAAAKQWNYAIEEYLRDIDALYGTNYCPSGAFRNV